MASSRDVRIKRKDPNKIAANQVSEVTHTPLPKGEDLLGSAELVSKLQEAKSRVKPVRKKSV